MVSWFLVSALGLAAGTGLSLLMLRRLLRPPVLFCSCSSPATPKVHRHAIITGATSGIGLATAIELARRDWILTLACRDIDRGERVRQQIMCDFKNANVSVRQLDMLDLVSIHCFADSFGAPNQPPIDVLIQNAGIMANTRRLVGASDIDSNMMTNAVSQVHLFQSLLPHLEAAGHKVRPRVIFVSSALGARGNLVLENASSLSLRAASEDEWVPRQSYANSKQVMNLCAKVIHRRFGKNVDVYTVVTGGMVNTNLNREVIQDLPEPVKWLAKAASKFLLKSPVEGCQTVLHCAISSDVQNAHVKEEDARRTNVRSGTGLLYRNCVSVEWPPSSQSADLADAVFLEVENLLTYLNK